MKIINKLLITLIVITFLFNFMILDNYNIYAEKINTYEVDPYTQESIEYINELKESGLQKSINNQMYDDIYQAMINLEDSVDLSSYGPPSSTEAFNTRKKVLDDHPEIFYFKNEGSVYWSDGKLEFKYIDSESVIRNMISELDTKVNIILNKYIDKSMSQMEKLIAIHDYIVLNTTYLKTTYCYDPYGVIVKGRGVCQGYSESMKLLLNKIGIECIYVSSPEMNHGWNIVNIDGENYHLDATWNDPVPNRDGAVSYKYLALSDYEMSKDHYWDRGQYPTCNSNKYKYMREMDYVVNGINYIYYSQTEGNWHIYKINKDGTNKEKIVNEVATPLYIKDGYLYYKEYFSGIIKKILIDEETVTNPVKVTDIKLNKTSLILLKGESEKLEATINPTNATNKTVTWKSSDESVAIVDSNGNVVATGKGEAYITANVNGENVEAECKVIVKESQINVDSITLNKTLLTLLEGESEKLEATINPSDATNKNVIWKSSDINVAKIDDKGKVTAVGVGTARITVTTEDGKKTSTCEVKVVNNIKFNDIKSHWAEKTIETFVKKGYINGYEDKTFKPDNNMKRAEFVKVVNKVFGYTQKGEEQFTDVNKDDWFYNDICIGIKAGYIKGKSTDIFAPNDNITREEVAMILTNIMKNKDENLDKLNTFKDGNKTSQWAQSSVEGAIEAGYLNGDDKGLLNPTNNITRAEAISMLSRVK